MCECDGSLEVLYECVRVKHVEKKSEKREKEKKERRRRTGNRSFSPDYA
jgi:hypothetical protein